MVMYSELRLGTGGADTIIATDEATLILALDGDDIIFGGAGNDHIYGGGDNDTITAGAGNDVIDAGSGDDIIYAGAGDDTIRYFSGNEVIDGGEGYDTLIIRLSGPQEKAILSADMWALNETTDSWEISEEGTHQRIHIDRDGDSAENGSDTVIFVTNVESLKWR